MGKFISGVVVGLLCGLFLAGVVSPPRNFFDRNGMIGSEKPPNKGEGWKGIAAEVRGYEKLFKGIAGSLDEGTREKWKKITTDPVWNKLSDKNKTEIWDAFKKTYVTRTSEEGDII